MCAGTTLVLVVAGATGTDTTVPATLTERPGHRLADEVVATLRRLRPTRVADWVQDLSES